MTDNRVSRLQRVVMFGISLLTENNESYFRCKNLKTHKTAISINIKMDAMDVLFKIETCNKTQHN